MSVCVWPHVVRTLEGYLQKSVYRLAVLCWHFIRVRHLVSSALLLTFDHECLVHSSWVKHLLLINHLAKGFLGSR